MNENDSVRWENRGRNIPAREQEKAIRLRQLMRSSGVLLTSGSLICVPRCSNRQIMLQGFVRGSPTHRDTREECSKKEEDMNASLHGCKIPNVFMVRYILGRQKSRKGFLQSKTSSLHPLRENSRFCARTNVASDHTCSMRFAAKVTISNARERSNSMKSLSRRTGFNRA